jgi:hypothetical protein
VGLSKKFAKVQKIGWRADEKESVRSNEESKLSISAKTMRI